MSTLQDHLDQLAVPGDLYEVTDETEHKIRCYACGHRCLIRDGGRGVCKVRFNRGGVLYVPRGYVGTLQVDPIEKKPFNHLDPGVDVISFGMLGCDLHCSYCFVPETPIITEHGVVDIVNLFAGHDCITQPDGAEIAFPKKLRVIAGSGQLRPVTKVFKHPYDGQISVIKPYYLPELRCTPDHRIYATDDLSKPPTRYHAHQLTKAHYLAIPRHHYRETEEQTIDVREILSNHDSTYKVPRKLPQEDFECIVSASAAGVSSKEIGAKLGKDPSYIRHVRSKVQRGLWVSDKPAQIIEAQGRVRFSKERRPGIPRYIAVDEAFARILGYYCAEGSIIASAERPNSYELVFAFGLHERHLAEEVRALLRLKFDVEAAIISRDTTLGVAIGKASLALLIMALCGVGSIAKQVPQIIVDSPVQIRHAFLDAYLTGDGHRQVSGKVNATTKSRSLAYGVALLSLLNGHLPSIYANDVGTERLIQDRLVQQSPVQYSVVWYGAGSTVERKHTVTDDYYLIPIREITSESYQGYVYNLEVEEEHNYLANFLLVSNCQNWEISQHGRDSDAGRDPTVISAAELIRIGKTRGAKGIASTYNEPLITSEWAVEVFKEAKRQGLRTMYISNGNGTPDVIHYLRPHLDGYKIDLKSMRDKNYRQLGAVLQTVLDTIKLVKEVGLWLEIVTLVIPGFNDSQEELWDAARYIRSISPDIPWHVTAFHPDYRMTDPPRTTSDMLIRAAEIGAEAGLNYVYAGNLPGHVGDWEHTRCPTCQTVLIRRHGFYVLENRLKATNGDCPKCGTHIPGIWV